MNQRIGILHPGNMGISVAASAQHSGNTVVWASEGRSLDTRTRAEEHNLMEVKSVQELCDTCSILISVCPPHAAEDVAQEVLSCDFQGMYVDANAISPERTLHISKAMQKNGISFVDGGIIGGPAWEPDKTWLYLSGSHAPEIAQLFSSGPLETKVIGDEIGKASSIKMCFAAYTKGTTALLCAILATAEQLGVRDDLEWQWSRGGSDFANQTQNRVRRVTAKAWRFAGEMKEIAATFESAGLPGGFHQSANEIYQRIAQFKGSPESPELEAVLESLLMKSEG